MMRRLKDGSKADDRRGVHPIAMDLTFQGRMSHDIIAPHIVISTPVGVDGNHAKARDCGK